MTERLYKKQQQKQTKQLLRHGEKSNSHTQVISYKHVIDPSAFSAEKSSPLVPTPIGSPPGTSGTPSGDMKL